MFYPKKHICRFSVDVFFCSYVDPNKKRTNSWLSLNRLQLPLGENNYDSIRKIAYADGKVKVQNAKNMTSMQKALLDAGIIDEFGNQVFSDRNPTATSNQDSEGNQLSKAQQEYFKHSKVRDALGRLLRMYHGTSSYGFTVFDAYGGKFGLFGKGSYFTDNPDVAESYTHKGRGDSKGVYAVYLNVRNPLDMDAKADLSKWKKAFDDMDLDASYLDGVVTNEDAFKALKEYFASKLAKTHSKEQNMVWRI